MNKSMSSGRQNIRGITLFLLMLTIAGPLIGLHKGMAGENDRGLVQEILMKIKLIVDGETVTATLFDTPTARDFASLLPLSITLEDYADIERISDLPRRLSVAQAPEGMTPQPGDITFYAHWGNLAIFTHGRAYARSLISLGKIDSGISALQRHGPLSVQISVSD